MNKLVVVNGLKEITSKSDPFEVAGQDLDVEIEHISSKDCIYACNYGLPCPTTIIHKNEILQKPDTGFFVRSRKGDNYGAYLLSRIAKNTSKLFSDTANLNHTNTANKMTMMAVLPLYGIPVPPTILCTPHSYKLNQKWINEHLDFPCVVKKTGSQGKNVWKVNNLTELEEKLNQDEELTILQEFIPNHFDIRVFVLDKAVIGCVKRSSTDGFYNNASQGGTTEAIEIPEVEKELCIKAADIAGICIAGVDIVRSDQNTYVLEVNKNPDLSIFNEALGFNLPDKISRTVIETMKEND